VTDRAPKRSELDAALASLAPEGVRTGSRRIDPADVDLLHPIERSLVAQAVPRRRAEFATGRVLLRQLIGTTEPILVGPDRAPVLPPGVTASLAHDHEFAVAAVDPRERLVLGVDVEATVPLERSVAELILRPDEAGIDAHLAFTLKEATYKAWSRMGGRLLEHQDVRLDTTLGSFAAGSFVAGSFVAEVIGSGVRLEGRYAQAGGRWVALALAPSPPG
jgi:4'-phosphopantetheinyl transferase EntD